MQLQAVELIRVGLELVTPFRAAHGLVSERNVLLIHTIYDDAEGWAECVAQMEPSYTSEYVDAAEHALVHHLVPALLAFVTSRTHTDGLGDGDDTQHALHAMGEVRGHNMARAAVEVAVLDAALRRRNRTLADHLGATRQRVPAGVAVGISESVDALLEEVTAHVGRGYARVKLKVMPGWDLEPVAAVRAAYPDLLLVVDGNGAYASTDNQASLRGLDDFGLCCIEQPLGERDLVGHATLAAQLVTPICLDEAITCYEDLDAALALGACSSVNLKVGRVGGLREAMRIHDRCVADGVDLWCGGMLETGLGRALNVAVAALPGCTQPGDLSASDRYYAADLTEPFRLHEGHLIVPTGPGLGVLPRPEVLARRTGTITLKA